MAEIIKATKQTVAENEDQLEISNIIGVNAKWYSHYGKQIYSWSQR